MNQTAMVDAFPLPVVPEDWEEVLRCPICSGTASGFKRFAQVPTELANLAYKICERCGLVLQTPRLRESWLRRFYEGSYHVHMHGQHEPSGKTEWVETRRAIQHATFVRHHLSSIRKHLDIGSSTGKLMEVMADQYRSESYGIEPASAFRQRSRQAGHQVVARLAELDDRHKNSYDLVSLSHVLEHLPEPTETLRRIREEWLVDGGHLLVEVPNLFGHLSFEISHLAAYTRDTLSRILSAAGFAVVDLHAHGVPYSRHLPFFIQALASAETKPTQRSYPAASLRAIRFRRWMGMMTLRLVWWGTSQLLSRDQLEPWGQA